MSGRRYFCRFTKVDGHTSASMLDGAGLLAEVTRAARDEQMLRVWIERGDLDDLVEGYHASQLTVPQQGGES